MKTVKPKKYLGQHFLKDRNIAQKTAELLSGFKDYSTVIEIGAGTGVLTEFLAQNSHWDLVLVELDLESIKVLESRFSSESIRIIHEDILKMELENLITGPFAIIGNFPYNISSQIFFKVLDYVNKIPEVVCMLQKEVAERICSPHGNKVYGILSVLIGAYYDSEILFKVPPNVFHPPPKVESAVIRLKRNNITKLPCDEKLFKKIVKQGFQNRRKTLRNALKPINLPGELKNDKLLDKRAEQLTVQDFVALTQKTEELWKT